MIKVIAEAKETSLKKKRLNIIDVDHEKSEEVEERQSMFATPFNVIKNPAFCKNV